MGGYLLMAPCISCDRLFTSNPELVPSVLIDPVTKGSPDVCTCKHHRTKHEEGRCLDCPPAEAVHPFEPTGDPARVRKEPLCRPCVLGANRIRRLRGLPDIPILPGAYEPAEEGAW